MWQNIVVKKVTDTEVELTGEVPSEYMESYRARALKNLQTSIDLPGFRKGHVPENILLERLGPMALLTEMAEMALGDVYPKIIEEHKLDAIDRPHISITKLAVGNPLGFHIRQSVIPEIVLPDYKQIAKDKHAELATQTPGVQEAPTPGVSDAELDQVIEEIKKYNKTEEVIDRDKVRAGLMHEKVLRERERVRLAVIDAILAKTKFEAPKVLVERQMDRFVHDVKARGEQMGVKWEDYVKHVGKTEEQIREDSRAESDRHVRTRLMLEAIGKNEKIEVSEEEANRETEALMTQYPDADPAGAHEYIVALIKNSRVLELLDAK